MTSQTIMSSWKITNRSRMKNILQGFFFLICWNSVFSQSHDEMVNIAIVEEMHSMTKPPDLVKGSNNKNKRMEPQEVPDIGTGVPDKISFEVTVVNDQKLSKKPKPVVINLERNTAGYEITNLYVTRKNNESQDVLVREDIPVDEGLAVYQGRRNGSDGAVFTVKCKKIETGECEPELEGSFYHEGSEYDLKLVTPNSPKRVKRKVRKQRKNIQRHINLKRKLKRQLRKSLKADKRAQKKRKEGKIYAVIKRKKTRATVNDYNPEIFIRKLKGRRKLRTKLRKKQRKFRKNKNKTQKGQSAEILAAESTASDSGTLPESTDKTQAVLKVARMVDSEGTAVMQTTREASQAVANQQTTANVHYSIELFIVADFSIYNRFLRLSKKTTTKDKDTDAKKQIRQYFAHIVNGMDMRFRQILHPDFSIGVGVVGYYVADQPSLSLWTTGAPIQPRVLVNAKQGVINLAVWNKNMKSLPQHDHMMLFTGHDLYEAKPNGVNDNNVAGYANVGTVCDYMGVSLNEDYGEYSSINTATHELAHSLNATHDGYLWAKDCSPDDHFIMSPKSGITTQLTKLNPFKFSKCSTDSIANQLVKLNEHNLNCMKNEVITFMESEFNDSISQHPGQIIGPNQQCERKLGSGSFYGWGGSLGAIKHICSNMACKNPGTTSSYNVYSAAMGTSCGDRKWCLNGICTESPDAPAKDENCMHGDSKRLINGLTCAAAVKDFPGNCYLTFYSTFCCDSCKKAINASFPQGCAYGDQTPQCSQIHNDSSLCYANEQLCCLTCGQYNTGIQVCKYGDKLSGCDSKQCSNKTYAENCCKTCGLKDPASTTTITAPTTTTTTTTTTPPPTTTTTTAPPTTTTVQTTTIGTKFCVKKLVSSRGVPCDQLDTLFSRLGTNICHLDSFKTDCCVEIPLVQRPVCVNLHASSCYNSSMLAECTGTCGCFETGRPNCPYGDRIRVCKDYIQQFSWFCDHYAAYCCSSCNVTSATNGNVSPQALRNFELTVNGEFQFTPPPSLKLNDPFLSTRTIDTTKSTQNMNFQEILKSRKERRKELFNKRKNKAALLKKIKQNRSNKRKLNQNRSNKRKTFRQILAERKKQKRLKALQQRRKLARQFKWNRF